MNNLQYIIATCILCGLALAVIPTFMQWRIAHGAALPAFGQTGAP
jgi:hypothetical protein